MQFRSLVKIAFVIVFFIMLIPFGNSAVLAQAPTPTKKAPVPKSPVAPGQSAVFLPFLQGSGVSQPAKTAAKKGVGLTYQDCGTVTNVAASWQYGWSPSPANCSGIENVPMLWGAGDVNVAVGGNSQWVMGFNEPDSGSQANISAANAATLWRQIEQKYPSRKLLAPAPSGAYPNWIVDFRNAYITAYGAAPRLDGLAVHCYAWYASQCITHTQKFEAWANSWGVPEVWVTEFSFSPTTPNNLNQALAEARTFINWMEGDTMITRFAWFASKIQGTEGWASGYFITPLADWNTGQPTAFGSMYLPFH